MENKDMQAEIKKNATEEIEPMLPDTPGQSQTDQSALVLCLHSSLRSVRRSFPHLRHWRKLRTISLLPVHTCQWTS